MQRTFPCHAAGSPLLPEVGVSHGKLQNPLSSRQRCPRHNTKNTTQRERSRTAVRTLQVYLTWFRSKDLSFGETGHQAPADGSCARGTGHDSPCDPLDGTFPLGLLHIHGLGRMCSSPTSSSCVLHRQRSSPCPHWGPGPVSTKGWRALAKAGITLPKLPVLRQQKGSQSCFSSGLSQVSPAFSEQVSAGFLGYPTQISWKLKGRPLESEQGLYGSGGSYVGADAKIWHLRSQHHQKILLTLPIQTLVSQGPSGRMCPSSVMGLSPSGNSPRELGSFLFCFSFLDEAFRVFPHVLVKPSFPNACLDAHNSINMLQRRKTTLLM